MRRPRHNFPATPTQHTQASNNVIDVDLYDLYTPVVATNYVPVATPTDAPSHEDSSQASDTVIILDKDEFAKAYFGKTAGIETSMDMRVLQNVAENDRAAQSNSMKMEDKKKYKKKNYNASVRPSRTALLNDMNLAVQQFREYSLDSLDYYEYRNELHLFWNALERQMMHKLQAGVKKHNATISIGHLRPQTMRLLEYTAPLPTLCKFEDKSTKLNGSLFKYKQYTMDFKFIESPSNDYGIPSDKSKPQKWFMMKYQSESNRWYFVKVKKVQFMYNFLLQQVKVKISFDTWLHMPSGMVEGVDDAHWTCI